MPTSTSNTIDWIDGISGDWANASDWVGGAVPTPTSNVLITNTTSASVNITNSGTVAVSTLTLDPGTAGGFLGFHINKMSVAGAFTIVNESASNSAAGLYFAAGSNLTAASVLAAGSLLYLNGDAITAALVTPSYFYVNSGTNTVNGTLDLSPPAVGVGGEVEITGAGTRLTVAGDVIGSTGYAVPGITANETYINMGGGATLEAQGALSAVVAMYDYENGGSTGVIPPATLQLDRASEFTGRVYVSSGTDRVELTGASGNSIHITPIAGAFYASTEGVQISGIDSSGTAFSFDMFGESAGTYGAVFVDDGTGGKYVSLVLQTQGSTTWLNDGSGLWSDATNWSSGVPGASSRVTISGSTHDPVGSGHGFNVTVTGTQSIASLSLDTVNPDQYAITLNVTGAVLTVSGAVSALAPAGWGVVGDGYHDARITLVGSTLTAASIAVYDLRIAGDGSGHSTSVINGAITTGSPWDDYNGITVGGNGTDAVINGSVAGLNGGAAGEAFIDVGSGATLELNGAATAGVFVSNFGGSSSDAPATLVIDHASTFTGQVVTSSSKERVDLVGVAPGSLSVVLINRNADLAMVNPTDISFNNLSAPALGYRVSGVDGSGHAFSLDLFDEDLGQNRSGNQLAVLQTSDGHGGTYLSMGVPSTTATWVNDASGDWYSASIWVGGVVPGSTADVTITNDGTTDMRITAAAAVTAHSLTINPDTIGGIVEATFSADLTLAGALTLETGDRKGAGVYFYQSGGTLSAQSISARYAGFDVNNATVIAPSMLAGSLSFSGTTAKAVGSVTADVIEAGTGTSAVIDGSLAGYADSAIPGEVYGNLSNGGSLEVTGAMASHVLLYDLGTNFAPSSPTMLKLDDAAGFTGYIEVTDVYDRVDLAGIAPGALRASALDGSTLGYPDLANSHGVDITGTDGSGHTFSVDLFQWRNGGGSGSYSAVITGDGQGGSYVSLVPSSLVSAVANTALLVQSGTQYVGGGTDQIVEVDANATVAFSGDGNVIILGVNDTLAPQGNNDTITAATGDQIWMGAVAGDVISGAGFSIHFGNATSLSFGGNATGAVDIASGSGGVLSVLANGVVEIVGDGNTIALGLNAVLAPIGNNDTITATSGDQVWLGPVTGDTITGGDVVVHVVAGSAITVGGAGPVTVAGTGATIGEQAAATISVWGDGNTIGMAANATLGPLGNNDVITATTGDQVWLGAVSGTTIDGAGVAVHGAAGDTVAIGGGGAANAADTAAGASITWDLLMGSNASFWGDGNPVISSGASTYTTHGAGDVVTAGAGDQLTDGGSSLLVKLGFTTGTLSLAGFGGDAAGVIDLVGGAGGYATAAAAWSALVDDGHGNSTLALGAGGSLLLTGVTKEMLSAGSFRIG